MKRYFIASLLAATTAPCFADSTISAELLLGKADQDISLQDFDFKFSDDDTSLGIRLAIKANPNIAFEIGKFDYGEAEEMTTYGVGDSETDKVESSSLNLGIKAIAPLNEKVSLVGRIGLAFWEFDYDYTASLFPDDNFSSSDDGNDFYYGVGVQINAADNVYLALEYSMLKMDANMEVYGFPFRVDNEVDNLALSVGYRF